VVEAPGRTAAVLALSLRRVKKIGLASPPAVLVTPLVVLRESTTPGEFTTECGGFSRVTTLDPPSPEPGRTTEPPIVESDDAEGFRRVATVGDPEAVDREIVDEDRGCVPEGVRLTVGEEDRELYVVLGLDRLIV
jgi:hypothetical protein